MLYWLRQLSDHLTRSSHPRPRLRRPARFRPVLETLEDRSVPAGLMTIRVGGADLLPMVLDDANLANVANRVLPVLPQATLALDAASDTGIVGDLRTNLGLVNLVGRTNPGFRVQSLAGGTVTTADTLGNFTLSNVPLATGVNNLFVQVTSPYGYTAQSGFALTRNSGPQVTQVLAPVTAAVNAADAVINIDSTFQDADAVLGNSIVRYDTVLGTFDVELFDSVAPQTVANYLQYVNDGDYNNTIFHRREPNSPQVLQGGGFRFNGDGVLPLDLPTDSPVEDEYGRPNVRGTISLAKTSASNSATNEFFFNLVDNTAVLSPAQQANGGFTVFGQVINNGMQVVDDLAALPITAGGSPFNQIPLRNFPAGGSFPTDAVQANYAIINSIVVRQRSDGLTFQVVGNSNPALVNVSVAGSSLNLDYQPNQTGTAIITLQATDVDGLSTLTTFNVTVS